MNKCKDNKSIQLNNTDVKYVIITERDGIWKYISKDYGYKHKFHFSVKMNKAKRFDSISSAEYFIDYYNLHNKKYYICQMTCNYTVNFRP